MVQEQLRLNNALRAWLKFPNAHTHKELKAAMAAYDALLLVED